MKNIVVFALTLFIQIPAFAKIKYAMNIPKDVVAQMEKDLVFASELKSNGSSPLFKKIFKTNLGGPTLISFLEERITEVGWDKCGEAVACVIPGIDPHTMYITQYYAQSSVSQILRLSIVFHEARHTEMKNNYWDHTLCPEVGVNGKPIISSITGRNLFGLPGCDEVTEGAYGLEVVLLKNVEKYCSNCNEKILMDSKIAGDDLFDRIANPKAYKELKTDLN